MDASVVVLENLFRKELRLSNKISKRAVKPSIS